MTDSNDTATESPSTGGIKPVIAAIPEECYQRSTLRGLALFGRDLALLALTTAGLLSTNHPLALLVLWPIAGLAVSGLFVIGHDAAHQALFDQKWLNNVVSRLAMLPSLHATEVWVFGHNRVHHGHTLRQGMDFVWHPLTPGEYASLSQAAKLRHRLEWSWLGAGAYYLREIWFNKMVRFNPPQRWRGAMRRDQTFVAFYAIGTLAAFLLASTTGESSGLMGGLWNWIKVVVVPFALFCQVIGWVVYVHHIEPETRWWSRREWTRFRGQVEGTTILVGPPGWDFFFHWIMVHLPHHVDARIPCYKLPLAADSIASAFPESAIKKPIRIQDYLHATRQCKLFDFDTGRWMPYPSADG